MFREQQEGGSVMGRGREREDGGQENQEAVNTIHITSFQVGRAITSFQEKGLVSALNKIRVSIHFNIYLNVHCSTHLKFLAIGIFYLSINSLYL